MLFLESVGPRPLDRDIASKLTLDSCFSSGDYHLSNKPQPIHSYFPRILTPVDNSESGTGVESLSARDTLDNVDASKVAQKVCDDKVTDVPKEPTSLSNYSTQSDQSGEVENQIKDLTDEVQFLKQLSTNKKVR